MLRREAGLRGSLVTGITDRNIGYCLIEAREIGLIALVARSFDNGLLEEALGQIGAVKSQIGYGQAVVGARRLLRKNPGIAKTDDRQCILASVQSLLAKRHLRFGVIIAVALLHARISGANGGRMPKQRLATTQQWRSHCKDYEHYR